MLYAFLFFHCNLAFSSIEKAQRTWVIDHCYTPMLDLVEHYQIPIGVEATGWTLEVINELRPSWLQRLKALMESGRCEFIGSGYSQLIGPLVPASVNIANQKIGQAVYQKKLGYMPTTALINEQAYAPGLLPHYIKNGYASVIMEWDNPKAAHPEWPSALQYAPQRLQGEGDCEIDVIWNQFIFFRQLQRLSHNEIEYTDYKDSMIKHISHQHRVLCLYGSDAEIFNFRPGRFETEEPLQDDEWSRIGQCLKRLQSEIGLSFCLPKEALGLSVPGAGTRLRIETAPCPVLVKKHPKYNILRWAVSGKDDLAINSRCYALAKYLEGISATDEDWKELCYLWGSDFRTHITSKRWQAYEERLKNFEDRLGVSPAASAMVIPPANTKRHLSAERFLAVQTDKCQLKLNLRKGLAIESMTFPEISNKPLFGTLPHGYFDSVSLAADYFSGHTVMEIPGESRKTDLSPVDAQIFESENHVSAYSAISGFFCPMQKVISIARQAPEIDIVYSFQWPTLPACSLRLLNLTLFPENFDQNTLFYATHNGGNELEQHLLTEPVAHGSPVSFMVSASCALGLTEGVVYIGDKDKQLKISVDKAQAALVGMITHGTGGHSFTRLTLSYREFDDTARLLLQDRLHTVRVNISGSVFAHSR
ncbi:MAG: alpha-amylase [Deltaproteobacteria bacterium]|jgi:hypothetical protein|nr:alpha-amylase [Deltaproteobacteria bacterium]